jgi:protein arginine kinase activator
MEKKICDSCQKREATVHLTEIVDGAKHEVHYCEECAQQHGVHTLSPQSFLGNLVGAGSGAEEGPEPDLVCTGCDLTYGEFRQRGRLGCPECYVAFREGLVPLLERIHGSAQHLGRVPEKAGEHLKVERRLVELKRELARVIQREEYEQAAGIRDRIRELTEGGEGDDS